MLPLSAIFVVNFQSKRLGESVFIIISCLSEKMRGLLPHCDIIVKLLHIFLFHLTFFQLNKKNRNVPRPQGIVGNVKSVDNNKK